MEKENKKKYYSFAIIGGVLITYTFLVFLPMTNYINEQTIEYDNLSTEYDIKQSIIKDIDVNDTEIRGLEKSIEDTTNKVYSEINQALIIKELGDVSRKANLDVSFKFENEVVAPINESDVETDSVSYSDLIKNYNNLFSEEEGVEAQIKDINTVSLTQMDIKATFKGSYNNLVQFIKLLNSGAKEIIVKNVDISAAGEEFITGSLDLVVYTIPGLEDKATTWKNESTKGSKDPFVNSYEKIESLVNDESVLNINLNDYTQGQNIKIESPQSSSAKMSKVINDELEVYVEFLQDDDEYSFRYKIGDEYYPKSGSIQIDVGSKINVLVSSSTRKDSKDLVGIRLNVKNTTDKEVVVEIRNDDNEDPRVRLRTDGKISYDRTTS